MFIEYEATFINIDKDEMRERLTKAGAKLVRAEFLQKRVTFDPPVGHQKFGAFLRVRDEGDKITLARKEIGTAGIADQKETCVNVSNFDDTVEILKDTGCIPRSYEETKRELWNLDGLEVTIDEFPFLEPFVEVEGKSEEEVRAGSEKLDFEWSTAKFCTPGTLFREKYGKGPMDLAKETGTMIELTFTVKNPFI